MGGLGNPQDEVSIGHGDFLPGQGFSEEAGGKDLRFEPAQGEAFQDIALRPGEREIPRVGGLRVHPEDLQVSRRAAGLLDFPYQAFAEEAAVRVDDRRAHGEGGGEDQHQCGGDLHDAGLATPGILLLVRLAAAALPLADAERLTAVSAGDQLAVLGGFRSGAFQPVHHLVNRVFLGLVWGCGHSRGK